MPNKILSQEVEVPVLRSRKRDGRWEHEIEPGRWVSRQRLYQLRNRNKHREAQRRLSGHKPWQPGRPGRPPIGAKKEDI